MSVAALLALYDENLEVEPYKQRPDERLVRELEGRHSLAAGDPALLPHLEEWTGLRGGADAEGLYVWSQYNPRSRWDWWEIGGRWCGAICGDEAHEGPADTKYDRESGATHLAHNVVRVRDLDSQLGFFALLTPEGEWYDRGEMGWFGIVSREKPRREWEAIRAEVLSSYPDHLIVGVDCHI